MSVQTTGFRSTTPIVRASLEMHQAGAIVNEYASGVNIGHAAGHSGIGAQFYREWLAGTACRVPHWRNTDGAIGKGELIKLSSTGTYWAFTISGLDCEIGVGDIFDIKGSINYDGRHLVDGLAISGGDLEVLITNTTAVGTESPTDGSVTITSANKWRTEDSTTGTKFYPDIEYFTSIKNLSNVGTIGIVTLEISGETLVGDNLVKTNVDANYNPDITPVSNYLQTYHGDEYWGQFSRLSWYNPSILGSSIRVVIGKGPSISSSNKL